MNSDILPPKPASMLPTKLKSNSIEVLGDLQDCEHTEGEIRPRQRTFHPWKFAARLNPSIASCIPYGLHEDMSFNRPHPEKGIDEHSRVPIRSQMRRLRIQARDGELDLEQDRGDAGGCRRMSVRASVWAI